MDRFQERSHGLSQHEVRARINAAMQTPSRPQREQFSLSRMLAALSSGAGLFEHSSYEGEICAQAALDEGGRHDPLRVRVPFSALFKRDLTVASDPGGGHLVGQEDQQIVEPLRGFSVVANAGCTLLPGLRGDVPVPKLLGDPTAYWLTSENTNITESALTLGHQMLTPKTAGCYLECSRQLVLQTSPAAEAAIARSLWVKVGRALDRAALVGSGTGGQPKGIAGTTGVGTASGTALSWAGIVGLRASAVQAAGDDRKISWIGGTTAQQVLASREKAAGSGFVWGWDRTARTGEIAGHAAYATADCSNDALFLADWSQLFIGIWGSSMEISYNPFANFPVGIIGVRAMISCDVAVTAPAYFSAVENIT